MVVWYGGNPILSDSAGYHTASKEAQDHTDHARSRKFKRHSIPSFKIVNKQPTLLDQMLSGAGPTRKPASDEEGGGGGEALSLNSGPPSANKEEETLLGERMSGKVLRQTCGESRRHPVH